jgi:alkylation response protein AidB-like acyl-CoA dehydrogenase
MNFEFSEEQKMFRDMARKFAEQEIVPTLKDIERAGKFNRGIIDRLAQLGLLGPHIHQNYGGLGIDYVTYAIIAEQLAWGSWSQALTACGPISFGGTIIWVSGSEEQKQKYLLPICRGEKLLCTAHVEPNAGSDAGSIETTAVLDGNYWIINGSKIWITNGAVADVLVVVAQTDKSKGVRGISNFIVESGIPGISQLDIHGVIGDRAGCQGHIRFTDVRIPRENLIGKIGEGLKNALAGIDTARLFIASACVGLAQSCIDSSIKYAKERHQFGKPIGSFQLVQEKIAQMAAETEAIRWLVYYTADLKRRGLPHAKEMAMSKWLASELGVRVSVEAIKVFGAYGCSDDYPIEHHYRDAILPVVSAGTNEMQKLIVGRELLGIDAII